MSIRTAVIGPTGYAGLHLVELLLRHPSAQISYLASRRNPPPNLAEEFPQLLSRLSEDQAACHAIDPDAIASKADVAFAALPHKASMAIVPKLLDKGLRVIDLSADYRLTDADTYERYYNTPHTDRDHLATAVYGLPELFREHLADAKLVATPGCYPTAAALAVAPLLKRKLIQPQQIIINATTGVTGAGRTAKPDTHFPELNESYYAYGTIGAHRHQPEIVQTLSRASGLDVDVLFVPHLAPLDYGILETIYADPADGAVTEEQLFAALEDAWDDEPFVRVRNDLPNVKHVRGTNYCDVTVRRVETASGPKVIVFSAIDNMIKGTSGQAIQNMNLMFGLDETAGLV